MAEPTEGERVVIRRNRLGWKQERLAEAAGIGLTTVVQIEKDRTVRTDKLRAVLRALEAGEAEAGLTQLGLDMPEGHGIGSPLHILRPSLHAARRSDLPRQGDVYQSENPRGADVPAPDPRVRELEDRLSAEQAAHAETRKLAAKLTDIIASRLEALETGIAAARHRKRR